MMNAHKNRLLGAALAGGALVAAVSLAGGPAMAAAPTAGTSTEVIQLPMTYDAPPATTKGAKPAIVVPGNCGEAFLRVSRTNGDEEHVDVGFEGLTIHAIYISGQVTAFNEDTGKNNHLSWSGPTALVQSWEKQGNMVTGSGEVHNIGTIHATSPLSSCTSSPALFEDVYVY